MRVDDWPERLTQVFTGSAMAAGVYGEHDCALHAMDCADALTGGELAAQWRGAYHDYLTGLRVLRKRTGLRSMKAWADTLWPRIHPAMARRGDWGMVAADEGPALAVFDREYLRGPCGLMLPRAACLPDLAWRVE
jgi:hypothetical protein